ncbi:TetR/AcrR family transcriptional regulator [Amycolatopsis saalfeldensis]|uniref:DNA-binding transcriptional regulator, AcrR family n=1 Tax=Amycolatopsis saalfeldensis TaxID=394193 RepID=A0A1H8YPK5_9PSEU|nr:TetR/AcrR family transcriptional regulator [Amycolatopsis saalfeldensis]SEP53921.1 DNA-binding transcriptional regulator, AcrR family [Amycolatopsis saalfeldensis]
MSEIKKRNAAKTKAAILRAAAILFAKQGYQETTVRAIAAEAGCNPALISRYFDGKASLYAMVVGEKMPGHRTMTSDVRTGARARELVQRQLDLAHRISYEEHRDRVSILLRSAGPGASGEAIRQLLDQLLAAPFGQHVDGPDAGLRASLLFVQLFGLSLLRDMVGLPQLAEASDAEILWYLTPAIHQILVPARSYPAGAARKRPRP